MSLSCVALLNWATVLGQEAATLPLVFSPTYTINPFRSHAMQHWLTPPLETGRHLTGTWKDGGRGSGSHLMRAFAGSKPLLIASFPASGHTILTLILGDG